MCRPLNLSPLGFQRAEPIDVLRFPLPDYQKASVGAYFSTSLPYYSSLQYNTSQATRGIPDIALNAANYAVSYAGANGKVYGERSLQGLRSEPATNRGFVGTSASSPVGAAIFTLINDARYAAGKGPIGSVMVSPGRRDFH